MEATPASGIQLEGLNDLEMAELRKEFQKHGISLDEVAAIERPKLDGSRFGEPGTAVLVIALSKIALPLCAAVLGAWLAKGRSRKRFGSWVIRFKNGEFTMARVTASDLVEGQTPESIQGKVMSLASAAGDASGGAVTSAQ